MKTFGSNEKLPLSSPCVRHGQRAFGTSMLVPIVFVAVLAVAFVTSAPNKQPVFVFNHSFFVVISASMEPEYPVNTLVAVRKESIDSLRVGDVIAFRSGALGGKLALHRIIELTEKGFVTKGDNSNLPDKQIITQEAYVGKCVGKSTFMGKYLAVLRTLKGLLLYLILPLAALMLLCQAAITLVDLKKLT